MERKRCTKCNKIKPLNGFYTRTDRDCGYKSECKSCSDIATRKYQYKKRGVCVVIYNSQISSSKHRRHQLPDYTRDELCEWLLKQPLFHIMYDTWISNNRDRWLKPSCDRLDDYKPYTLANLRLVIWRENNEKSHNDRKNGVNNKRNKAVIRFDYNGNPMGVYYSISYASRMTGIGVGAISNCINGLSATCGGYLWTKSEANNG